MLGRLIQLHRLLGTALFALFVMWFATGILMLWGGYPEWGRVEALRARPRLAVEKFRLNAGKAWESLGMNSEPLYWEAGMQESRPLFRFRIKEGWIAAFGDNGMQLPPLSGPQAAAVVEPAGKAGSATMRLQEAPDQWTVYGPASKQGALWKLEYPDGEYAYVSVDGGQILHRVTRSERAWAWASAIPHWIYPVQLRKHADAWVATVQWISGPAIFLALSGLILGLWRWRKKSPYARTLRWHHLAGLAFGWTALSWIFSGWMSMGAWGLYSDADAPSALESAWKGTQGLSVSSSSLLGLPSGDWRSIEGHPLSGRWVLVACDSQGKTLVQDREGRWNPSLPGPELEALALKADPAGLAAEPSLLTEGDSHYYATRWWARELPVWRFQLKSHPGRHFYASAQSGRLLSAKGPRERLVRWLYSGLHSWDIEFLRKRPGLQKLLMLPLLAGGLLLSLTGLILAFRRLNLKKGNPS